MLPIIVAGSRPAVAGLAQSQHFDCDTSADLHRLRRASITETARSRVSFASTVRLNPIGSYRLPHPHQPNRHRARRTASRIPSRDFLPWRFANAGPQAAEFAAPSVTRRHPKTFTGADEGLLPHFTLISLVWITFPYLSVSAAMKRLKTAGDAEIVVAPNSARRNLIFGSARPALTSVFSLSTMSAGVFRGAPIPNQEPASYPATKSLMAGTSGNVSERVGAVTANGLNLPLLMSAIEEGIGSNITCTCPPSRSANAGADPRYGTSVRSTPAIDLNSSMPTCWGVPMPANATFSLPGLAFA